MVGAIRREEPWAEWYTVAIAVEGRENQWDYKDHLASRIYASLEIQRDLK